MTSYYKSHKTYLVTDGSEDVPEQVTEFVSDFVFKVFFSPTCAIQRALNNKEVVTNIKTMVSSEASNAVNTLKKVYPDVGEVLSLSSVDVAELGSKLIVQIILSLNDVDGDIHITHEFHDVL